MSKERLMILEMLASGKITPAEANVLIHALGVEESGEGGDIAEVEAPYQRLEADGPTPEPAPQPAPGGQKRRWWPRVLISKLLPNPASIGHNRRRRYPDPSYAAAMKRSEVDFSIDQLFRMQEEDIDPEQAARMVRARRPEWTTEDMVELLTQGACPDLVNKLNEMGIAEFSVRDVIQLTEYGVDPDYLQRFKEIQMSGLTARDLIEFFDNDVNPDLAIALKESGPVTTGDIVKAAGSDLSPNFVRRIGQVLPGITVHQLIELSENDVSLDFIQALVRGGFTHLTIQQIINLQENDVDPNDAAWFRKKLGEQVTADDLVRLASHDIGRDTVEPLLEFNLPNLNVDTLIELVNHDVCVDVIKKAQKVYGNDFTTSVLIELADNW